MSSWAHIHLPRPSTCNSKRKTVHSFQWVGKGQHINILYRSNRSACSSFSNTRLEDNFLDTEQRAREEEGVFFCFHQFLMSAGHFRSCYFVGNQTLTTSTALCGLEIAMPLGTTPMLYRVTHIYPCSLVQEVTSQSINPSSTNHLNLWPDPPPHHRPTVLTPCCSPLAFCHLTLTIALFKFGLFIFSLCHTTVMSVLYCPAPTATVSVHCLCPTHLSHFMSIYSFKCLSFKLIPNHPSFGFKLLSLNQTLQQHHHHVLYVKICIHSEVSDITSI